MDLRERLSRDASYTGQASRRQPISQNIHS